MLLQPELTTLCGVSELTTRRIRVCVGACVCVCTHTACVQAADLTAPTDGRVVDHINKAVDDGIQNVSEMMRYLHIFVKSLLPEKDLPQSTNRISTRRRVTCGK